MKERAILFSAPMVRAILDGTKTQTRRVVKDSAILMYGLHDDRISIIHMDKECINDIDNDCWWHNPDADSSLTQFGLHGGGRWANLLAHTICGIWQEGVRGLVCVERPQATKGLLNCVVVPRKHQGDKECSSSYLHGVSRHAREKLNASTPSGWQPREQLAKQFGMGNSSGELARSHGTWQWDVRRKTSQCKTNEQRAKPFEVGNQDESLQSATCRSHSWDNPSIRLSLNEFVAGRLMWVRETHYIGGDEFVAYRADMKCGFTRSDLADWKPEHPLNWRPSIFMPHWASRITLEITDVRVERLNDISRGDCMQEGCPFPNRANDTDPVKWFSELWESLGGSWEANPWVWVIDFKLLDGQTGGGV